MFGTLLGPLPRPPRRGGCAAGGDPRRGPRRPGRGRARAGDRRRLAAGPRRPRRGLARRRRPGRRPTTKAVLARSVHRRASAHGGSVEPWRRRIADLAAAGCPLVEVHEPAAVGIGDDAAERARFRDLHERLADGWSGRPPLAGDHRRLGRRGRRRDHPRRAVSRASRSTSSTGPDNWRLVRAAPRERGIVCGALDAGRGQRRRARSSCSGRSATRASGGRGDRARRPRDGRRRSPRLPWASAVAQAGAARRRRCALASLPSEERLAGPRPARRRHPERGARPLRPRPATRRPPATADRGDRLDSVRADGATIAAPRRPRPRRREDPDAPGMRGRSRAARHVAGGGLPVGEHIPLTVNGTTRDLDVEPRRLLVQALREDLDLTGTHVGCDTSQCGACTVHVDGTAVKSCTMLAVQADGAERHDHRGHGARRAACTRSRTRSGRSTASSAGSARRA